MKYIKKINNKKTIALGSALFFTILLSFLIVFKQGNSKDSNNNFKYVNEFIFDNYYPVVSNDNKIIKPYLESNVKIHRNYYEINSKKEEQEKSIIYFKNTYIQNTGIDYMYSNKFDIVSSYSGTVINVEDDELMGKSIHIKNGDYIFVYQSLSDVFVNKNDKVTQGQIIAKSGTNNLEDGNFLHFEIYKNGVAINPINIYDKTLENINTNK